MRVLIDTNVLVSVTLSTSGTPYLAYVKATALPCRALICEQTIDELKRVFSKKFHECLPLLHEFLSEALPTLELVPVPPIKNEAEAQVRDASDRPILRAALAANADVLLTGDKDFLEAGLIGVMVLTPLGIGKTVWIEKDMPSCGPLDAIVKPVAVSPCTSDIHTVWEGAIGDLKDMILGHEAVGEIVEVGSMVKDLKVGDKVIVPAITPDWGALASQAGSPCTPVAY